MAREDPMLRLRLPPDLKEFVQDSASHNQRSMNGEIVYVLRQHQKTTTGPQA